MKILIAGATGLIGTSLVEAFQNRYEITVLGRDHHKIKSLFEDKVHSLTWDELTSADANQFDLVYNLCGQNIGNKRWSPQVKQEIINSRTDSNHRLIDWLISQDAHPQYFSASAIGIYGLQSPDDASSFNEDTVIEHPQPRDFLMEVGMQWEQSLQRAIDYGLSVTMTRFGVVLKHNEGFLKKLAPSFYCGLGSIIGTGNQMISWIHIDDLIDAVDFLIKHNSSGPYNISSPHPVAQKQFAKAFAQTLHRPLFLKTPTWVMRTMFGEMGECLINQGARVYPKRLIELGFKFDYPDIDTALNNLYQ